MVAAILTMMLLGAFAIHQGRPVVAVDAARHRDQKWPAVVRQQTANDCGLAALATMAHDMGLPLDEQALYDQNMVPVTGLNLLSLRRIAAGHGIKLLGVFIPPETLSIVPGPPWIAHFRAGKGHYVVVEQVQALNWTIADPAIGRVVLAGSDFRQLWSGYALILDRLAGEWPDPRSDRMISAPVGG